MIFLLVHKELTSQNVLNSQKMCWFFCHIY